MKTSKTRALCFVKGVRLEGVEKTSRARGFASSSLVGAIVRALRYAVVIGICLGALWFAVLSREFWVFDHIEQNAKKVITGSELQMWAVQVVAQYPSPSNGFMRLELSNSVAPLPKPLLGLYHNPPDIYVYETTTSVPGYVRLIWGGGMIGHCGFEIGPTNFVGRGHPWQDGVYFWREN